MVVIETMGVRDDHQAAAGNRQPVRGRVQLGRGVELDGERTLSGTRRAAGVCDDEEEEVSNDNYFCRADDN
jgi:hypothetical protein